jgi:hypothetical protein
MIGFSLQEKSIWAPALRFMASCLAHMGRLEEAQELSIVGGADLEAHG